MSKYVLNENTALIVNGEVYVLAREKVITKNSVCDQCDLYDSCVDYADNHWLSCLCIPEDNEQGWFFKHHLMFSEKGGKDLVRLINKCFPLK